VIFARFSCFQDDRRRSRVDRHAPQIKSGLVKHDGSGYRIAVARADGATTERDREALPGARRPKSVSMDKFVGNTIGITSGGYWHAAYAAYASFVKKHERNITLTGCWAHLRRNFYEAREQAPQRCGWILRQNAGTVIGSDGYGYVLDEGRHHKSTPVAGHGSAILN
jgi:hypothetical protein